jgi:acetyl-CoA C-acetyltransferase
VANLRDAIICSPVRTAVGRYGGALKNVDAETLAETVVRALVERTGIDPATVDDCILGHCNGNGDTPAIGRQAALSAGLPVEVPGLQVDRRCGSGLQAICMGAMQVQTGVMDLVIAGGVESMSTADFYTNAVRWGPNRLGIDLIDRLNRARVTAGGSRYLIKGGMIETAENLARKYAVSRQEQDEYSLRSHQRAVAAWDEGRFEEEVIPVTTPPAKRGATETVFRRDEHPRPDTSLEKLAALRPLMAGQIPDATVTAGNASGENDAAACCVVTTEEKAAELGLKPRAKLVSWAAAGVHPAYMGLGPVAASQKALDRAGLTLGDMELVELNEAFAAQTLACTREWNLRERDFDRLNVNGSGISIGHPVGATGARIMTTILFEMARRGLETGLVTMCIGGGQGISAVVKLIA